MDICREELSSFADGSGNSDSNAVYDPEIPRADYWTCLRCKNKNNNPLFRYCEKCYKVTTKVILHNYNIILFIIYITPLCRKEHLKTEVKILISYRESLALLQESLD